MISFVILYFLKITKMTRFWQTRMQEKLSNEKKHYSVLTLLPLLLLGNKQSSNDGNPSSVSKLSPQMPSITLPSPLFSNSWLCSQIIGCCADGANVAIRTVDAEAWNYTFDQTLHKSLYNFMYLISIIKYIEICMQIYLSLLSLARRAVEMVMMNMSRCFLQT